MNVTNWQECLIPDSTRLREVLRQLDRTANQILLVVDSDGKLAGTITDGDVRRSILRSEIVDGFVRDIMNTSPVVASNLQTRSELINLMTGRRVRHLPIVNERHVVCGLVTEGSLRCDQSLPNKLVVMAGGLGTRLRPITETCPKPLVEINGYSVLHRLLTNAANTGISDVTISVRYLSQMIVEAVGYGEKYGLTISYIDESQPLGTAGALTVLDSLSHPVICVLGDVLIDINYRDLVKYHLDRCAKVTLVTSLYVHKVPFGVVNSNNGLITSIKEKPMFEYMINAGVLVVDPDVISAFPRNSVLTQPEIVAHCINHGLTACEYCHNGSWFDIGSHEDLQRARAAD
jgi:dTDP-glucose pyrophosphorylase/predicted transcriptional regulator